MDTVSSAPATLELFFSYAHEDEKLRDSLAVALSGLRREGLITEWYDRKIGSGKEFDKEIDRHIESAKIILLLVSADFLNSDYCWGNEVARALQRHHNGEARVIPIILRPTDWKSAPFSRLQALPRDAQPITLWDNRDAALEDIAIGIRKAISDVIAEGLHEAPARAEVIVEKGLGPALPAVSYPPPRTEEEAAVRIRSRMFSSPDTDDIVSRILQALNSAGPAAAHDVIEAYLADVSSASVRGLVSAAGLAQRLDFHDLTCQLMLEASEKSPADPELRRNLAVALSAFDQDDLALPFARRLVEEHPDNEDYVELLAQVLESAGHSEDAWVLSTNALEDFPTSTYLFEFALTAGEKIGKPAATLDAIAERFLSQDFSMHSDDQSRRARGYSHYGSYLARVDRDKEAVEQYKLAFEYGETSPASRGNYAVELAVLGQDEEAERQFRTALNDTSDSTSHSRVKRQYMMFLLARGRTSEAAELEKETWVPFR